MSWVFTEISPCGWSELKCLQSCATYNYPVSYSFPWYLFFVRTCGISPEHHNVAFSRNLPDTMQIYDFFSLSLKIQLPSAFQTSISVFSALSFSAQQDCCALLGFLLFVPESTSGRKQSIVGLICFSSFRSYSPCVSIFQRLKRVVSFILSSALVVYGRRIDLVSIMGIHSF